MSWSVIRKATEEDVARLNAAAERFAERHNLRCGYLGEPVTAMDIRDALNPSEPGNRYLLNLWKACIRRALRHKWAEGIAYGCVGFHVD